MSRHRLRLEAGLPALMVLGLGGVGLAVLAWRTTGGNWAFPLDDTYIHLALARTWASSGTWGLAPGQFSFCSSSPGYTLLLSLCFWLDQARLVWPLLLNAVGALGWIGLVSGWLPRPRWLVAGLGLLLPLPLLVLLGMEHSLHLWAITALLGRMIASLQAPDRWSLGLGLLAAAATALRYESLFLLGAGGLLALWQERPRQAATLAWGGGLSPLLFGAWSQAQGGPWLPLPLTGKGHGPLQEGLGDWLMAAVARLYDNPFMLVLLLALTAVLAWQRHRHQAWTSAPVLWVLLPLAATAIHLLLAEVGGYRYEAYLVGLGLLGLARSGQALTPLLPRSALVYGVAALACFPLGIRAGFFYRHYPRSVANIYQQPVQVARFLAQAYPGAPVAVNDIGAVSYYGTGAVTDLVGVSDRTVQEARRAHRFGREEVAKLAQQRGFRIVVGHAHWIGDWIPPDWEAVETWTIPANFICAGPTVTWWAVSPGAADTLRDRLRAFAPALPRGVQRGQNGQNGTEGTGWD